MRKQDFELCCEIGVDLTTVSTASAYERLVDYLLGENDRLNSELAKLRIESVKLRQGVVPLNEHTREILGRPSFGCIRIATRLRELGHEIKHKAEDEQAVTLHWLLNMWQKHGDDWRERCEEYLHSTGQTHNEQGQRRP